MKSLLKVLSVCLLVCVMSSCSKTNPEPATTNEAKVEQPTAPSAPAVPTDTPAIPAGVKKVTRTTTTVTEGGHEIVNDKANNVGGKAKGSGDKTDIKGLVAAPGNAVLNDTGNAQSGGLTAKSLSAELFEPKMLTIIASIAAALFGYSAYKKHKLTPDDWHHWGPTAALAAGCLLIAINNALLWWALGIGVAMFVLGHLFPSTAGVTGVVAKAALGRVMSVVTKFPDADSAVYDATTEEHDVVIAKAAQKEAKV